MANAILAMKKAILEKRLAALFEEYTAVNDQIGRELSDADRLRLARQAESLWKQIVELNQELRALEVGGQDVNRRHLELQASLLRIDFKSASAIVEKVLQKSGQQGCAAVFLLQKSQRLGGEYCVAHIRDVLRQKTSDLKYWPVDFSATGGRFDEYRLLDGIAGHLNVPVQAGDLQQYTQTVVRKMCDALQSGSIAFLDLRKWDNLHPQERILTWFLDDFWHQIVEGLATISLERDRIKCIALLLVDDEIPTQYVPISRFCTADAYENGKILRIPLKRWTKKEIHAWLEDHSQLTTARIDQLAEKIYRSTEGLPPLICKMLCEELGT